ncbi:hypothetical protein WR25_12473 [Diploscapter pachys]|uniref:Potassium channel domain-containing protein n=1 Tax=Diploscapter pachys TaxID=2018661 RepID=A0A2A2KDF9_9BILA|nr:hypothetical protein WR25_12473 [Diploscapter pachys]
MGRLLSRGLRKLYKRLRTSRRKIAETAPIKKLSMPFQGFIKTDSQKAELTAEVNLNENEDAMKQNRMNANLESAFPISIALAILSLWILFSSLLFCIWEQEWGFLTAIYFYFVSISTVGLGDVVFHNVDYMILNFILILVGLALLSMCFNLIQAALERLLDRLLDEYIEEIEKMAEIVANDEFLDEEAMPLEFKMSGNLLTLPMKKVTTESGLFAEAKGWFAERIANNLLASRLGKVEESDEEEEEEEEEEPEEAIETIVEEGEAGRLQRARASEVTVHEGQIPAPVSIAHRQTSIVRSRRDSKKVLPHSRYHFQHNKPLFKTIQTLEKIKPQGNDLRSMIFSKFLHSERLGKIVDETAAPQRRFATVSCQTDMEGIIEPKLRKLSSYRRRCMRIDSTSSFSTVNTSNSVVVDDDSLMSNAYCDLRFDYSDPSTPSTNRLSTCSMMRMDEDELVLPPKFSLIVSTPIPPTPRKSPTLIETINLAKVIYVKKNRTKCTRNNGHAV